MFFGSFVHNLDNKGRLVIPSKMRDELGAKASDPLAMYLTDIATIGCNLAGIPGISVPAGFDNSGMPIGLQILAPQFEEGRLFNFAYQFEQSNDFWTKLANI